MRVKVKVENQVFEVEIEDLFARPIVTHVAGERYEVWPEIAEAPLQFSGLAPDEGHTEERVDGDGDSGKPAVPAAPRAAAPQPDANARAVLAPIPGVIVSIAVTPGTQVKFGQELCVLEAMKMKNPIRAARAGRIGAVCVNVGQTVRHHDVLMEFTE